MCGRFLLTSPIEALRRAFGVDGPAGNEPPRWNIAPTQNVLALRRSASGAPVFTKLRWGLVPGWARDPAIGSRMINARAESVAEKPAYRDAFRKRRCLVLADGFYEWPELGDRRPVLFRLPQDAPFAFAGLWESWRGGDGATLETCTILSTAAHGAMTRFHHRVPMTVPEPERARWLDASEDMRDFVARPVFEDFLATRVTTHVNAVRNDDAGCVAPAVEEEEIAGKKVKNSYNDKQGSLF